MVYVAIVHPQDSGTQELVLAAVKHHGQSLADAHESLRGDREVQSYTESLPW